MKLTRIVLRRFPSDNKEAVVTIGVFDGIHKGHQAIIKEAKKTAGTLHLPLNLITFSLHPLCLRQKKVWRYILPPWEALDILSNLGVNYLWIVDVNREFLNLEADEFIARLMRRIKIKTFVVGEDFRFGRNRKAGVRRLRILGDSFGFNVVKVKKIREQRIIVSSSYIRKLILKGEFSKIKDFLSRDYVIKAKVIKGQGLGKIIGFPTANLLIKNRLLPRRGVYVVKVFLRKRVFLGVCNIGIRPTLRNKDKGDYNVEIHIIGFDKNKKIKSLEFTFLEKIRNERKFSSLDKLQAQIEKDIQYAISRYSGAPTITTQLIDN